MRLDVKALGFTFAILGGGSILLIGIANLMWPDYGGALLGLAASVYPGYDATSSFGQVIVGTLYGLLDCFIAGLIVSWVYNLFAPVPTGSSS